MTDVVKMLRRWMWRREKRCPRGCLFHALNRQNERQICLHKTRHPLNAGHYLESEWQYPRFVPLKTDHCRKAGPVEKGGEGE